MDKNLSNKYDKKQFDSAEKSNTDARKTASKRIIQNTADATGDLIGDKIAKMSRKEMYSQNEDEIEIPKESYITPEKRQQIFDELRLA